MENHELGNGDRMFIFMIYLVILNMNVLETVSNRRNLILNVELPDYSNKRKDINILK